MDMSPDITAADRHAGLPPVDQIRRAVSLYLERAYVHPPPVHLQPFIPSGDTDISDWLMGDRVEREPRDARSVGEVKSFAIRLGNMIYPHMKLRISRTSDGGWIFMVDTHDAFLKAPPASADESALNELKRQNATLACEITSALDAADLPTEHNYMRQKIKRARDGKQ